MSDNFWFNDFYILINKDRLIEFIPTPAMSLIDKLNALMRFSIYLSLLLFIFNKCYIVFYLPLIVGLLTCLVYKYKDLIFDCKSDKNKESFNNNNNKRIKNTIINCNKEYSKSTKNNPFMNVLITDYVSNPQKDAAPIYYNNKVEKKKVNDNFNSNLYKDIGDIFHNQSSQREFYTMPNTTIPNDQKSFAEWCYKTGPSCKEGVGTSCNNNIHKELNR